MDQVAPAFPSATVMLVRDAPRFEVLMVQRHHQIEFASGALVFPGGKLDQGDHDPAWLANLAGAEGLTDIERALRICAIREAFEESGMLLVGRSSRNDAIDARAAASRSQVAAGEIEFREFVAELELTLDLSALTPFARWVTPSPMKKRFDTHFFLMSAPSDQVAACDGYETVDAIWVTPQEALRLGEAGERTVVFPTRLNLRLLAESTSTTEAIASAASRPIHTIEPTLAQVDGRYVVSIPDSVGYGPVPPQHM